MLLRPGNAGSNTAADHIAVTKLALRQLPSHRAGTRPGRKVLIRADGGGGTHEFLEWLTGQRLSYSIGWRLTADMVDRIALIPTLGVDRGDQHRPHPQGRGVGHRRHRCAAR